MRGDALALGGGERARGCCRHPGVCAGARERRRHQALEVCGGNAFGAHAASSVWPGFTRLKTTGANETSKRSPDTRTRENAEVARSPVSGKSSRKCAPRESVRAWAAAQIATLVKM